LNGKPLAIPVIRYDEIMAGASLKLVMGPAPSHWASDWTPTPLPGTADQTSKN
jgi:putative alpha-1,2-mannosidase